MPIQIATIQVRRPANIGALPLALLLGSFALAQGKLPRRDVPEAPLPAVVVNAKRVFLLNGQTTSEFLTRNGNALAFDSLYADMRSWGKYELVDSPRDADIVIELQYRPHLVGSGSFGTYNTMTTRNLGAADFALVIYEAKSKNQLWSVTDACRAALRVKNQQKEVVKSIGWLVKDLRIRSAR